MLRGWTCARWHGSLRTMALTLAFVLLIAPTRAHAYLDPGSGALIWQGLLAAVFGALVYVRKFIQGLRGRRALKDTLQERPSESSAPDSFAAQSSHELRSLKDDGK